MAKITYRRVKSNSMFLEPYVGCIAKLTEYKNGRMDITIPDGIIYNVQGDYWVEFIQEYRTVKSILGKPLKQNKVSWALT